MNAKIARMAIHLAYALFDTAIGRCGIAWNDAGILGLQLPEADDARTRARLLRHIGQAHEQALPAAVLQAQESIVALLRGEPRDLGGIALDMKRIPPFDRSVYAVARAIAPGSTLTYGEVAARLPADAVAVAATAAQAVGAALGRNPYAIIVPCHRVLAAGGKAGGFSARGGAATKLRLLAIEGAWLRGTLFE
jgi:methylated-DNA-[protein]-cysteine S-methyltransferase